MGTDEKYSTAEAEALLYRLMLWAFTTNVHTSCRVLLGRYVNDINMTNDDALAIRDAFNLYWDELKNSDIEIDVMAVAGYAKALGCNSKYLDSLTTDIPLFFSHEVALAIEVLTGTRPEVPGAEEWNERVAIIRYGG